MGAVLGGRYSDFSWCSGFLQGLAFNFSREKNIRKSSCGTDAGIYQTRAIYCLF